MEAVLGICPYDAEQAAGVKFAQVYRCFVPVQERKQAAGITPQVRSGFCKLRSAKKEEKGRKEAAHAASDSAPRATEACET